MKNIFIITILLLLPLSIIAKTTYIPTYYSQINVQSEEGASADSSIRRELVYMPKDYRYSITVLHDSVTHERIKAIKNLKAASGWSMAASIMSGVSAGLNPLRNHWDAHLYTVEIGFMASSAMYSVASKSAAVGLQKVPVTIIIENNSDRELVINDMKRGLTWFIPAKNYIELNVGNPEVNKLRIAYAECGNQKKDYITIQAGNILEKETIEFEDEQYWGYYVYETYENAEGETESKINRCEVLDKVTFEKKIINSNEFAEMHKLAKIKEKERKKQQ